MTMLWLYVCYNILSKNSGKIHFTVEQWNKLQTTLLYVQIRHKWSPYCVLRQCVIVLIHITKQYESSVYGFFPSVRGGRRGRGDFWIICSLLCPLIFKLRRTYFRQKLQISDFCKWIILYFCHISAKKKKYISQKGSRKFRSITTLIHWWQGRDSCCELYTGLI